MRVICTFALVGYALASGYLANARRVALHNARFAAGLETYSLSLNQFANYSSDEFAKFIGLRRAVPPTRRDVASGASSNAPPSSVDWRAKGVVGPVPNQGQCAADWAFASVGAVQSAAAIKRGQFVLLSVEEIEDCTSSGGCNGGDLNGAWVWMQKHGVCTAEGYPANAGTCASSKCTANVTIAGVSQVAESEVALETAVAAGPVVVAVDAAPWQLYSGGIFSGACPPAELDHVALLVGYGTEGSTPYWIVQNSWGTSWGEAGYIRLARGPSYGAPGICGIQSAASYPKL